MAAPSTDLAAAPSAAAILHTVLPPLVLRSLSVVFFPGKWRALREKLKHLQQSLAEAFSYSGCFSQPLFLDILPAILSSLKSLQSLSDRCHARDLDLAGGKLLLQSDLDIAAASLSLRLRDLDLLLRSGLFRRESLSESSVDTAIVLFEPRASASVEDLALFVRDLFTRLQIGGADFKKEALESLIRLFAAGGERIGALVAGEGDVSFLIHLMEASSEHYRSREQAAAAVCFLATASEISRKAVFEEGGLGPLLRLLESGPASLMEKAAAAIEALTAESSTAWAVPAYGGIPILLEACRRSRNARIRSSAAGSLRNLAAHVSDSRAAMAEEGAISVLLDLLSPEEDDGARRKSVHCIAILAASGDGDGASEAEAIRLSVIQEGGLHKLLQFFRDLGPVSSEAAELVLRGISALSCSPAAVKILSSSPQFPSLLAEAIKHGSVAMQQLSAAVLGVLALSEDAKKAVAGAMPALVKLMEIPKPASSQEAAARALLSLLAVKANQKKLCKDEKSTGKLVALLDPSNDWIRKELPVGVVAALAGGGGGCRRRLSAAGACLHLQKLADMEVVGARKALQRISSNRIRSILSIAWRE